MTQNQRSYYAVIRELKATYGLTHSQARRVRSHLTDKFGAAPRLKDLKSHPVITKQAAVKVAPDRVREASKPSKPSKRSKQSKPSKPEREKGGGIAGGKTISTLRQWDAYLNDYDGDFIDIEYDDTAGYGDD